jgi:hypothetical protein
MLSVIILSVYAECCYVECQYAECFGTNCIRNSKRIQTLGPMNTLYLIIDQAYCYILCLLQRYLNLDNPKAKIYYHDTKHKDTA